ncbi:MAG: type restriction enzyme subunit [Thermoanaerobacter sp.]|nr:type restriction enzyme subunit [Thermoanaerobacter sp.]
MGSEWRKVKLEEIAIFKNGKKIEEHKRKSKGKYRIFGSNGIIGETDEYLVKDSCIVIGRVGACGSLQYVNSPSWITDNAIFCKIKKNGNLKFLYYVLKTLPLREMAGGSAQPLINQAILNNIEIKLPPLPEQQKIASILSAFDDKIELNNEMNKTLEEIAQAIFKHWFIDFEFPNENGEPYKSSGGEFVDSELGPIPRGWKVIKISEICEIQIGGDWGKEDKFEGAVPVYCLRGVDLQKLKENGYSNELPLRWVKKSSLEKRMLSSKDILIAGSGIGPVGRTLYFHENITNLYEYPLIYSNFCKRIRAKSEQYAIYIEQILENMYTKGEMALYINGTSVPNLNINGLIEHKVVLPTDDILNKYADFKSKVLARKYSKENLTLSQLRDTLLPKLISGEIRVM